MAIALSVQKADYTRRRKLSRVKGTLTGNYTTGGDPLDFTNVSNPGNEPDPGLRTLPPVDDLIVTRMPAGYTAEVVQTTNASPNLSNAFALKVYSAPGQELAAGAYPAAITGGSGVLIEADTTTWGN